MKIRFLYSVSDNRSGAVLQRHDIETIIEVVGEPNQNGMPSVKQLVKAEREFLAHFDLHESNRYLLSFVSGPADGSKGRYSEYRAYLPAI